MGGSGVRGALNRIRRAGSHLITLINDILSFARIEAGRVELDIADLSVDEIVATAEAMIQIQAERKGLSVTATRGPDGVRVRADRERTIQILANLLTNAEKFTEAGSVEIDWYAEDRAVCIQVRDTGRGIPAERLKAIFGPFVQVGRSAYEQRQGVGLGLAIARELAHAMDGDLTVESTLGAGSTFALRLPRVEGAQEEGNAHAALHGAPPARAPCSRHSASQRATAASDGASISSLVVTGTGFWNMSSTGQWRSTSR